MIWQCTPNPERDRELLGGNDDSGTRGRERAWSWRDRDSFKYELGLQISNDGKFLDMDLDFLGDWFTSHCSWSWHHPPGFAVFLGLE